jgi:hypothetical protein
MADPASSAAFLMLAFVLAGTAQTVWFRSPRSAAFAIPIDLGLRLRGRRVFGDNKTIRGFVVMVPAAAAAFALLALAARLAGAADGLWPISTSGYALVGAWAGFAFMLGELPNSFVKRQLDIDPGDLARTPAAAACQLVVDRLDSGVAMLIAVGCVLPLPAAAWALVLTIGPFLHWSFAVILFRLGLKARPA